MPHRAPPGPAGSGKLPAPAHGASRYHCGLRLLGTPGSLLMDAPQVLLDHHLKTLRLPTFLREYDKVAQQCAAEGLDFPRYLLRLSELELLDCERRATECRTRQVKFDVVKSLDGFDWTRCEFIERKENVLALGNSRTGKTHIALALGLAA